MNSKDDEKPALAANSLLKESETKRQPDFHIIPGHEHEGFRIFLFKNHRKIFEGVLTTGTINRATSLAVSGSNPQVSILLLMAIVQVSVCGMQ